MSAPILVTKLYIPPPRSKIVPRSHLIERLDEGLQRELTLISAPAGFGKTTLVSEWVAVCERPVAWLSLDEGDNDPASFLTYLVAALQTIKAEIGAGILGALQSPQPPPPEMILTSLLNEITTIPDHFILVLDDYHLIDSKPVDKALTFLLEHLPPPMQLVLTTREDPDLPLARLRARNQLTELRAADLRFTPSEAAEFLNQMMGLNLSAEDIAALETRTEGWIAGLQLAALSMQGSKDVSGFIREFAGDHQYIVDYLVEEVLKSQPQPIRSFLLQTAILDRLNGSLCDAVTGIEECKTQLEALQRGNFFLIPLDDKRNWYRYHHLFADVLRMHLMAEQPDQVSDLHRRASEWYEDNGQEIEAFQHAAAANDIERAERIIEGKGIPLHVRGALVPIRNWLASLPKTVLDARPSLGVMYATLALMAGQSTGVEEKLQTAEAALASALQGVEPVGKTRDLIGQIAAARATLALSRYQPEAMITQAHRALEYLHPDNLPSRVRAIWTMGFAYQVTGDRAAARQAYTQAVAISQASGNIRFTIVALISLGVIQEYENQLHQAVETFRDGLQLAGDFPQPFENEAHLGLARIFYQWNDLEAAEQHGLQGLQLARQFDSVIDRFIICEVFLARLKLAQGDIPGAAAMLSETEQTVRQNNFVQRIPEVAGAQVLVMLRQGDLAAAAHLAQTQDLLFSQARVYLAQGNPSAALAVLEPLRHQMEAKGWQDERLKVMVLQAVALHAHGEKDKAGQLLGETLALAEPGGFIRLFVDEGPLMAQLLSEVNAQGIMPNYIGKLLAAFDSEKRKSEGKPDLPSAKPLIESLSQRELEILKLIAQGLSNREIGERLFLALDTVKGHNRKIFDKLQVQSRTEAVARARELGLL